MSGPSALLSRAGLNIEYELLPYHRMGQPKYGYLGRRYDFAGKQLDREKMKRLIELAR